MYWCQRTERRRSRRYQISLSVIYRIEGPVYVKRMLSSREYEGNTLDISQGGVALSVNHFLPLGTKLTMKFILLETDYHGEVHFHDALEIGGEVRSTMVNGGKEYRLGICFEGVDDGLRETITNILSTPLRPEPSLAA